MKTVTVTLQIVAEFNDKFTTLTDVEAALSERVAAFLYAHLSVVSTSVVPRVGVDFGAPVSGALVDDCVADASEPVCKHCGMTDKLHIVGFCMPGLRARGAK